jgi:hypothetical protein
MEGIFTGLFDIMEFGVRNRKMAEKILERG